MNGDTQAGEMIYESIVDEGILSNLMNVYDYYYKDMDWSFTEMLVFMLAVEGNLESKLSLGETYDLTKRGKILSIVENNLEIWQNHHRDSESTVDDFDKYVVIKFCVDLGLIRIHSYEDNEWDLSMEGLE